MNYIKSATSLIKDIKEIDGVNVFILENGKAMFVSKKDGNIVSFKNSK